jgi:hypothetical protein
MSHCAAAAAAAQSSHFMHLSGIWHPEQWDQKMFLNNNQNVPKISLLVEKCLLRIIYF